jgi:hypothetical protein
MTTYKHPALQPLEILAGLWTVRLVFPGSPATPVDGHVSFEWLEGGAFLLMRFPVETTGPQNSFWLMGRDETSDTYTVPYFDTRGVSRVYQMSLANGEWQLWRHAPGFSQRYFGKFSADQNTITARWEKSTDGLQWEHDFDLTYARVK